MKFMAILAFVLSTASASFATERPNILYLYVDDMGWGSIGPNGQAERKAQGLPYVMTPNLDKLATAGVNFRNAYGCFVCSPARSSQQTGFHQGYTFADRNDRDNAKKAIRRDDLTMGDLLAQAGYVTGYWGKWGYGGSRDLENPTLLNHQTLPTSHGYQHVVAELHHVRAHTFFQPTLWTAPAAPNAIGGLELKPNSMSAYLNNKAFPNYPAYQNHEDYPKIAYCDDVYAFAALEFVKKQALNYRKTGQPFFGLFAAQIPHAPYDEIAKLPEWDKAYEDQPYFKNLQKQSQQWCAMVTRIDAHLGNLLAALEDPNGDGDTSDSVADNTLIIFQSDNGGAGGSSLTELNSNGGLAKSKGSIMEGGIRVPTIIRWPARINAESKLKAGTNSELVMDCTDLLPTFSELAGVTPPVGINGVSFAPYLTGSGESRMREFLIHEAGGQVSIIRGRDKLIRTSLKKAAGKDQIRGLALYDLAADHGEKTNIADQHPGLVKVLNALLTAEHVDQPPGFANTYHQWTGAKGVSLSGKGNWTDYIYENAGIEYMKESGQPKPFWIAKISNGKTAVADSDAEFLGLEIGGGKSLQMLTVSTDASVIGRNEIRISQNGRIDLQGGTLRSQRWTDVMPGGVLAGHGSVNGSLYVQGKLELVAGKPLVVSKTLFAGGELIVSGDFKDGAAVISAGSVSGTFTNTEVTLDGKKYKIIYSEDSVNLIQDS